MSTEAPTAPEKAWTREDAGPIPPRRPRVGPWLRQTLALVLPGLLGLLVVFGIWELWIELRNVPPYLMASPSAVAQRLYQDPWFFTVEGLRTLEASMIGFFSGASIALVLAVVMSQSRFLERAFLPTIILVKVTPIIAIAPLLVIWFGFGLGPKVFIAALIVYFPVMVNALIGFRSINPNSLALFESLAANRLEVFYRLRLPSSLPYLFAAFRFSIPLSVIGAVVAEWFSGDRGLGSVIFIANSNLDMATAFAGVFSLAIIGIGLYLLMMVLERRVLFWHESNGDVR